MRLDSPDQVSADRHAFQLAIWPTGQCDITDILVVIFQLPTAVSPEPA